MSWQEELRKLDEELAAGQISADDYRVRRDQVLSSAVTSSPATPPAPPPKQEATQFIPTGQQPVPQQPQPMPPVQPAFPPQGTDPAQVGGGQPDADKTQIVTGQGSDQADRTQAVGGWQTARPGGDADRTQVVPGVPPQHFAGGQPPRPAPGFPPQQGYQQMGWHQQQDDDLSPPWAGSAFPPLHPTGSPEWARQGPEVFEDSPSSGGKRALVIALVVLVLAGIGTGLYFLVLSKDDPGVSGTQPTGQPGGTVGPTSPRPTSSTRPRPSDPNVALLEDMPKPPATLQQDGKVLDIGQLVELRLMDAPEVQLLSAAGVTKVAWRGATRKPPEDGPTPDTLSAVVIPTSSEAEATELLGKLRAHQESQGLIFIPEPLPNMPPSVVFEKRVTSEVALYRGLYVSGKNLVRITTTQTPLANEAALSGSYRNHTEVMLRTFPAES